jgi:lysophospholipase L1-like esterase
METRFSTKKKLLFTCITVLGFAVILETASRVIYYMSDGFNPYYLSFGFVVDTQYHSAEGPGYSKFSPNTVYHQKSSHDTVDMRINADGFRNPENFVRPKPAGTFRVLTMGESSTFGYGHNEDHQTYPFQLEQILRQRYPGRKIQVYNLGIPHFRSNNILALAKTEAAALEPDLITVYAGYNNALLPKPRTEAGTVYHVKDWLYFHSVAWRVVHTSVRDLYYKFVKVTNTDPVGLPNLAAPAVLSEESITALRSHSRQEYHKDLEQLADTAQQLHAVLMPITQSYTLFATKGSGLEDQRRSYQGEVDKLNQMYAADKHLTAIQSSLLVHRDLMDELHDLSKRRNLPLVDGIQVLDTKRVEAMASYVHLTPMGNTMLATAIADAIGTAGLLGPIPVSAGLPGVDHAHQ